MPQWKAHPVEKWGGDVGGDHQASDCWEARYDDASLGAVVTVYWYAIELDSGKFRVERQHEYLTCRDVDSPGATETWADYRYHEYPQNYATAAEAESAAREHAHRYSVDDIDWNGLPG